MKFLQEVLKHSQYNQTNRELLTVVFSRVVIEDFLKKGKEDDRERLIAQNVIVNLMRFLLTSAEESDQSVKLNEGESDSDSD